MFLAWPLMAQQITPGQSFVDGQRITAAQLTALVGNAIINPAFYSGAVQHNTNLLTTDILLLLTSGGVYQQMPGSGIIQNPLFYTSPVNLSTEPGYALHLYYNPSNNTIVSITLSNMVSAISSNLVAQKFLYLTNLIVGATNSLSSNTNQPIAVPYPLTPNPLSTNNQTQFIVYDTNYVPNSFSFSNLLVAEVPYLGTSFSNNIGLPGYMFTNLFYSWLTYPTNTTSNAWGYNTNFPITNLYFTNAFLPTNTASISNKQTLTNSDAIPIITASQGSNQPTTFTLGALYQYLTNLNALPAYAIARAQFTGVPAQCNITNVNTTSNYFFATNNGLVNLQAVSFKFTVSSGTSLPSTPQIVSNVVYYVQLVGNGSNFMLFTNYSDAVATNHPIVPTGTASTSAGQNVLLYLTNFTAFNADAITLCSGTSVNTGHYDVCFRTPLTTTNYYVTGITRSAVDDNNLESLALTFGGSYLSNKVSIVTGLPNLSFNQPTRISILVQPE